MTERSKSEGIKNKGSKNEAPKNEAPKNEGEGNRTAARHYNEATKRFVDSGKVDSAAHDAEKALSSDEAKALREAEAKGKAKARH